MLDHDGNTANAKTLACQRCEKCFTRPENLARHMKTHDSIQKHKCQTCGRRFTRSDLRRKHEMLHERDISARSVSKTQRQRASRSRSSRTESLLPTIEASSPNLTSLNNQHAPLRMSVQDHNVPGRAQEEPTGLDQNILHRSWAEPVDFNPYFDYTTFARPWNYHLDHSADTSDWFSSQFFAALRETDLALSPPFQTWDTTEYGTSGVDVSGLLDQNNGGLPLGCPQRGISSSLPSIEEPVHISQAEHQVDQSEDSISGRTSRVVSPPNESSHEDRLPFAWNPRSRRIVRAKPIMLQADDPIFVNLDPTVELSQATFSAIELFLRPLRPTSSQDTFILPELPLVNVFISLFFNRFSPQTPVLHRPTLTIESLPPPLLAIMMVVGSCYSRLRHTRRFGIIVWDRVRQNLLASIEDDNSLMREPLIIYSAALVCYMGLWCGNKRTFELSEALRAVIVTYIRRLPTSDAQRGYELYQGHQSDEYGHGSSIPSIRADSSVQSQWLEWTTRESQKRLRWFVYMIDSQFPAILGMSGMLTIADVRKWECPCDEDFWTMATAKAWKNRLGSASQPSCPVFGSLSALLLSASGRSIENDFLPGVNAWSANLLMTAIMSEIFHYQETLVVLRAFQDEPAALASFHDANNRAANLFAMLDLWHASYDQHQTGRLHTSSFHHQRRSNIAYYLARIYLVFPISEIQDCLGRSGHSDSKAAMSRLGTWIVQCAAPAMAALEDASLCISIILANDSDSDPYYLIGLFLCHVVIWSFAHAAPMHQKRLMLQRLHDNQSITKSIIDVIEAGFVQVDASDDPVPDAPQLVFRHAIQTLVQQGTWGASANLALLLHLHPGLAERSES